MIMQLILFLISGTAPLCGISRLQKLEERLHVLEKRLDALESHKKENNKTICPCGPSCICNPCKCSPEKSDKETKKQHPAKNKGKAS